MDLPEGVELSVVLCDDAFIRELNATWRQIDEPTDVLAFPSCEPGERVTPGALLGDIIINLAYAERLVLERCHRGRVAKALGVAPEQLCWTLLEEIEFLFIHGLLHLLGHDHAEPDEERLMRREERRLWLAASSARREH